MKKLLSVLLALTLCLALVPPVSAASGEAVEAANALFELGLFKGTGTDENGKPVFDLDRAPARTEGVTMLVRLLGAEEAAQDGDWDIPFPDVPDWAKPYVGYAYENGLTNGGADAAGNPIFDSDSLVSVSQYLTFVLRALGYSSDPETGDFRWDKAWELSDAIGLTHGEYNAGTTSFTRGDVAILSWRALSAKVKGHDYTLRDSLAIDGYVGYAVSLVVLAAGLESMSDAAAKEDTLSTLTSIGVVERSYEASLEQLDRIILFGAGHRDVCEAAKALRDHWAGLPERGNSLDEFSVWLDAIGEEAFIARFSELNDALDDAFTAAFPELAGQGEP